jgi:membrane protein insertase, yidC/oxa1 family
MPKEGMIVNMGFISEIFGYVLNFLYGIFNNYGIAIIVFSVLLRIILIPITIKQQKALKKNAKLQKEMKEIQEKYRSNPERLNQETIELYKREKMGPFSGCLSGILQIVIILSVFWLVSKPLTYMKKINPEIIEKYAQELKEDGTNSSYTEIAIINKKAAEDPEVYINMEFLGLDLSKVPTQSLDDYKVYIIPILYVISSIISIKLTTKMSNKNNTKKEKKLLCEANDKDNIKEEKQPDEMEMMQQMNNNMSYMMPIMSVLIAIIAPLGLALYWFISNVLMIIERLIIDKFINQKEEIENE